MKKILVTGAAGFIGMHTTEFLLNRGDAVVGIDNLNAYYDPSLKEARLAKLRAHPQAQHFTFVRADLADAAAIAQVFEQHRFDGVINLAAQAGVRYSLKNPQAYIDSNLTGFINILEGVRHQSGRRDSGTPGAAADGAGHCHLVYASSSSVYGGNKKLPFAETDRVDHPVSLYAATKKANELMAHTYSHLFRIPATGLRFFTVYGPWGRPDMAAFIFTKAILAGEPITVFNHGKMQRDFTYIDDIVQGVVRALDKPPVAEPSTGDFAFEMTAPHRVLNIGNHNPELLTEFIAAIEDALGMKAKQDLQPLQPGDVPATYAETSALRALTGFAPSTPLRQGIARFIEWYRGYYKV
ncbi:MAG: SDR family NAD(P)-dependent oxidoreductase [Burkholderiaceae bacterium]|nr:SDR family NAD(P)-dependent oxidoreductase [Burkholderiaceae bacterium]